MPYHFEFDSVHRILLVVLEGEIHGMEIEHINNDIRVHVQQLNPAAGISDFSPVTNFDVASFSLRSAALQPSPYPETTTRFIVAPTDYLFGMARMYEMIANRPMEKLRVVRSLKEALAILGVQDVKFDRLT